VRFWTVVVAVLAVVRVAHAEPAIVVVGGTASEHQQAAIRGGLEQATRDAGWTVGDPQLAKKHRDALLRCAEQTSPWTCVPGGVTAAGIRRVFVIRAGAKQGDAGTPVTQLIGTLILTDPETAVVRQRFCEHCADDGLGEAAADLARQVLREIAVQGGRTVVVIRSHPESAEIILDGERIGATNASFNTFPGKHVVVIEKPGYHSETREFVAEEGKTARVSVTLRGSDQDGSGGGSPGDTDGGSPSRLVPALVLGVGLAAIAGGVALQATKDGPAPSDDQPRRLYSAPGIGLMAGGAAVAGLGVFLWLRATSADATSAPTVSIAPDGASFGWAGRF
jgi:hypothetical protein